MPVYCTQCGASNSETANFCSNCGNTPISGGRVSANPHEHSKQSYPEQNQQYYPGQIIADPYRHQVPRVEAPGVVNAQLKSRVAAGLLGIFLGTMGIHRFYLGYTGLGVLQLLLGLGGFITCGITTLAVWIWTFIEGIMILTGSISTDSDGRQLGP